MKVAIGGDHAGYDLKEVLKKYLTKKGYEILDKGPMSDERCDYADFGHLVANSVEGGEVDFGFLMCGSGNGINMAANKHQSIRAALCWKPEIATLAKQHNKANICTIPARFVSEAEAIDILDAYLNAEYEGGRHQARIDKIPNK